MGLPLAHWYRSATVILGRKRQTGFGAALLGKSKMDGFGGLGLLFVSSAGLYSTTWAKVWNFLFPSKLICSCLSVSEGEWFQDPRG